jgi:hypothetical protein
MNDIDSLKRIVHQFIQRGLSREETFLEAIKQFGFQVKLDNQDVAEFFKKAAEKQLPQVPPEFHTAVILIRRAFEKFQRGTTHLLINWVCDILLKQFVLCLLCGYLS